MPHFIMIKLITYISVCKTAVWLIIHTIYSDKVLLMKDI